MLTDRTKAELKELQGFHEVHEYKLLGALDALFAQGVITEGTLSILRNHIHDITNWTADLYCEVRRLCKEDEDMGKSD